MKLRALHTKENSISTKTIFKETEAGFKIDMKNMRITKKMLDAIILRETMGK